jgi:hypothetical protein
MPVDAVPSIIFVEVSVSGGSAEEEEDEEKSSNG